MCSCPHLEAHFALCRSCHQVIFKVLAAVLAGTLKVEVLLQLLLAVCRQVEEVHIADSQLLPLRDLPYSTQLNSGTEKDRMDRRTGSSFM